ncbi:MAG: EAL domain-containing protein [Paludibacter sp.]|nr:EAL domain-containing protein [Paludibacter sp.]
MNDAIVRLFSPFIWITNNYTKIFALKIPPVTKSYVADFEVNKKYFIDEETHLPNRLALFASKSSTLNICLVDIRNYSLIVHSYRPEISEAILIDFFSITMQFAETFGCTAYRYDVDIVAIAIDSNLPMAAQFQNLISALKKRLSFYIFDTTPYSLEKQEIAISASFGTSFSQNVRSGIFSAEKSLRQYKRTGFFNNVRLNGPTPDYQLLNQQAILFVRALENDRAFVLIQPIMDCDSGFIVRYEALIRIQGEKIDEVLSPAHFIDGVYAFGLSDTLFLWVFNEVIQKSDGREISINILPANILSEYVRDTIYSVFEASPQKACCITFEILEVQNDGDLTIISSFIDRIREYGAKIAIDDFGTGYSNFHRVFWEWSVDFIKIDGNFIQRAKYDARARLMIAGIAKMAKENGILTIAEYVSDAEIFKITLDCGVDYMQGYHISQGFKLEHRTAANDPKFHSSSFQPFEQPNLHLKLH